MKNLFTKFICIALICNFYFTTGSAQCPSLDEVIFPPDITVSDDGLSESNASETLTPDNLIANYGYTENEVYPIFEVPEDCIIGMAYEDQIFSTPQIRVLRTWTVINWTTSEVTSHVQLIKNFGELGSYCESVITVGADPWTCSSIFSLDDCLIDGFNYQNLSSDPVDGTELSLGITLVTISGTVEGEDFECQTVYKVIDNSPPVAIVSSDVIFNLDPATCTLQITPDMIDNGSFDAECGDVSLSVSPAVLTQGDANSSVIITLTVTDESGNINWAFTTATVNECGNPSNTLACIGITTAGPLNDNGLQFYPEDFLATGISSDDLSLTLEDEDGNLVPNAYLPEGSYGTYTYTVTDNATGDSCFGTLSIPLPYLPCTFLSCLATTHAILPASGSINLFANDFLASSDDCDNLSLDIADTDGNIITSGPSITLSQAGNYYYTVNNEEGNSCWGVLIVSEYVACPNAIACQDNVTVGMQAGGLGFVTVSVEDLLVGDYSGCDVKSFVLEIEDNSTSGNDYIGNGHVQVDQAGEYSYKITNPEVENSCWGVLTVLEGPDCETLDDLSFPANIDLALTDLNDANVYDFLSPENLVFELGFSESEANPTWTVVCGNIFHTYSDVLIELGNGSYKIIRTWTALDWYTAQIREEVQIIQNIVTQALICDFLPNSSEVGDCGSGHTDEDDVEWPDDLVDIADYRIKPDQLAQFSLIDPADTKPIFVNNLDQYSTDYVDILTGLQANRINIKRVWTVENGGQVVGNYTQEISIDISNFSSLVSAQTMLERPIPEVDLNNEVMTNETGVGYLDGSEQITLSKDDESTNGVTIKDLLLIQQYILGLREFSDYQLLAADYNNDGEITATDLIELKKSILEVNTGFNADWFFIDNTGQVETTFNPKGNFIGIKPGDVDDDAFLGDPITFEPGVMILSDVLINNGESYEATLEYDGDELSLGVEIHMYYDASLIEIDELFVENPDMGLDYWVESPGELHVTLFNSNNAGFLFADENLINIKFTASSNGLLSQAIYDTAPRNSYLLGLDYELVNLSIEFDGQINTGLENTTEHSDVFMVYPNPTIDLVNIEFIDSNSGDFTIELFDTTGRLVSTHNNEISIDVSTLNSGIYIYRLTKGTKAYSGHLSVIK